MSNKLTNFKRNCLTSFPDDSRYILITLEIFINTTNREGRFDTISTTDFKVLQDYAGKMGLLNRGEVSVHTSISSLIPRVSFNQDITILELSKDYQEILNETTITVEEISELIRSRGYTHLMPYYERN